MKNQPRNVGATQRATQPSLHGPIRQPKPLEDVLRKIFPSQFAACEAGCCPTCGRPVGEFRDAISLREAQISGMCQACQDEVSE